MSTALFASNPVNDLLAGLFGGVKVPPVTVPLRLLGLPGATSADVTHDQVRSAFRAAVMRAHPDLQVYTDPAVRQAAEAAIRDAPDVQELIWARDVLLRMIPKPATPATVTATDTTAGQTGSRNKWRCKGCNGERTRKDGSPYGRYGTFYYGYVRFRDYCTFCVEDARVDARREDRRQARTRPCDHCGELFTPPRSDGRYCTPACRQKAYRRRQNGGG